MNPHRWFANALRPKLAALGLSGVLLAVAPATAGAEEGSEATVAAGAEPGNAEPGETAADEAQEAAAPTVDPLTLHMTGLVERYYTSVGIEVEAEERSRGIDSVRFMLLDGVSLSRIQAAVDEAIRLHSPGRRAPFEIAVPLRVRPADPATAPPPPLPPPMGSSEYRLPPAEPGPELDAAPPKHREGSPYTDEGPGAAPVDPAVEDRRAERRKLAEARRQRIRLYHQWRQRTREKRMLLAMGVPLLASGYGLSFASASALYMAGGVRADWSWVTAVPVVGGIIFTGWTEGDFPWHVGLSMMELSGVALIVTSLALKVDWPYDRDPLALRVGRKPRRGQVPALVLRPQTLPGGMGLQGRF